MKQLFDGLLRVLDLRAVLAIVLLSFELLQEAETRRSGRMPRSAVLGHAETLLAALRHSITSETVQLTFFGSRHPGQASCDSPETRSGSIALISGKREA